MAEAIIPYSRIIGDDGAIKKAITDIQQLEKVVEATASKLEGKLRVVQVNDTKGVRALYAETLQLKAGKEALTKSKQALNRATKKSTELTNKERQAIANQREENRKANVEARAVAKIKNTQAGSIENLRAKLALVTISWAKLTRNETENTKRGKRLTESKKRLNAELLKLEQRTGDNRRQVGAYHKGLGKLRGSLISVAQAAGVTLGLFGAFRLLRNTVSIVRDFEKQNATLAGVLQKTKSEISDLSEDAKRLGSITVKTAGEVAKLQTEYARLGFSQSEILALTEPTIEGSIAMNSELSETALLVGAVVNSYDDLSATNAPEIIDILSLATASSALNFQKLSVALPVVLGAANALNVPLTTVTATLGKLADSGIEASTGATSLRNIFIAASAKGIDYKDALEQVRKSTDKLKTANDLFGKRAAVSALVIANNTEAVGELDKALQDAAGTAKLMAEKELDTLDGSIKLLTSAWEGFVLKMNDATNGGNALSRSIRFLAENLETIFKVVGIATTTYISYTLATKAANLATKASIVWNNGATVATNLKTAATTAATAAQKAFNTAVKSNPIGLLVALLAAAVTAYFAFRDSATAAQKAQKIFNDSKKESFDLEVANIQEEKKIQNERINNLEQEIRLRKAKGENVAKLDKEFIERKKAILLEEIANNQKIIDEEKNRESEFKKRLDERNKIIDSFTQRQGSVKSGVGETRDAFDTRIKILRQNALESFKTQLGETVGVIEARNKEISQLNDQLNTIDKNLNVQIEKNNADLKKIYLKRLKELALLRRRLEDLQDGSIEDDKSREIQQTKRKFDREIAAIKGNSQVEIDLREALETEKQSRIQEVRDKFYQERLDALARIQVLERSLIEDDTERQIANEKAKSKKILEEILKNESLSINKKGELQEAETKRSNAVIDDITLKANLKKLEDEKAIDEARIEQQRGRFETQKAYEDFKNKEFIKIQRAYLNKRLEYLSAFGTEFQVEIEQIKAQLANLGIEAPPTDPWQEFSNELKQILSQVGVEVAKNMQIAVNASKKALSEQQKAVDNQQARAQNGLTNTLAFEQKELAKREAQTIKRQKRLDRIQKLQSYWNTYNANLSSLKEGEDSNTAIIKTLKSIAVIEGITASLQSFGEGGIIEDKLPSSGIFRGQSHQGNRGGIPIMVEGKEGIFSTREMANMGRDNFYALKDLAGKGQLDSNFFSKQHSSFATAVPMVQSNKNLEHELKEIKAAIQSKPTSSFDFVSLNNGVTKMIETVKSKNKTVRNHYKINKPRL